jgi:hypothetical protein
MKKTVHITLLSSLLSFLSFASWATNYDYIGANNGNWSVSTNWSPLGVPSTGDNVTINSKVVNLNVSGVTINDLTLGSSVLQGANALTITGNLIVNGGSLLMDGNVTVAGNFTITNSGGTVGLSTATSVTDLTIAGLATFSGFGFDNQIFKKRVVLNGGGNWIYGRMYMGAGSILEVPATKTLTVNLNATSSGVNLEPFGTLDLKGTLRKQGVASLTINAPLVNTGQIIVETGILAINRVPPTSTFYSGSGSITVNSGATIQTDFLDYSNPLLTNNGTISYINNYIYTINLNGTTQQTIAGTGSINRLQLNNASGVSITGAQTIGADLIFNSGKIQLGINDLSLTAGATITGADATKYVQTNSTGNLKRSVSTSDVLFPVGESNYTPVTIKHTSGTDVYAVRVSDGIDITHPLLGTQYIGKEWDISRATVSSTPATVKLEWNSADVGVGYSTATAQMLHYNSGSSNWEQLPVGNRTASTALSLTQSGVTSFSPFSVGLPAFVLIAELIDFKAISHKSTVDLLWQTASEKEMLHFDIEQSTDGLSFSKIGETKAVNKANSYIFNVQRPLSINAYFRLKIVNSDGSFTYSKVLSVAFGKDLTVKAFPNPIQNELTIDVFSDSKQLDIQVIDVLGRSIYQKNESNTEGSKLLTVNTLEWLSGIYFLKISDGKKVFQQKIVKR